MVSILKDKFKGLSAKHDRLTTTLLPPQNHYDESKRLKIYWPTRVKKTEGEETVDKKFPESFGKEKAEEYSLT